jgi:hypothetical protein
MYSVRQIKKGVEKTLDNPKFGIRELNRIFYSIKSGSQYNKEGAKIIEADWDTLIILDACRYDMFEKQCTLEGTLEKKVSRGSHTSQFLQGNFANETLHDTVYTTATPQMEKRSESINTEFHSINNVWDTDRWDNNIGTVPPSSMNIAALEAIEQFPNKRHIIHYIQPHFPFVGSQFAELGQGVVNNSDDTVDMWGEIFDGVATVNKNKLWDAYRHNLDLALESVEELLKENLGKVIVTSDHGNMIGERSKPIPIKEWGHPPGIYTKELVTVPWLEIESEDRRKIVSEEPVDTIDTQNNVEERLANLGYV